MASPEPGFPERPGIGRIHPLPGDNPKDLAAQGKPDLSFITLAAMEAEAYAMMDGAKKYGPFNWRNKNVLARVYTAAAIRHIKAWEDGEEFASDSGVNHLGHARACLNIILDAQRHGCLADDRPLRTVDKCQ